MEGHANSVHYLVHYSTRRVPWRSIGFPEFFVLSRSGTWADDSLIDCLRFHGKLPGRMLIDMGLKDESLKDGLNYEAVVWVIGNYVIRALLNPSGRSR